MIIIGCDFHTRFQQIAMLDPTTGCHRHGGDLLCHSENAGRIPGLLQVRGSYAVVR